MTKLTCTICDGDHKKADCDYCIHCIDLKGGPEESLHKSPHSPSKCKHFSCDKCKERHRKDKCKTQRVCTNCGGDHRKADCKVVICRICSGDHKKAECNFCEHCVHLEHTTVPKKHYQSQCEFKVCTQCNQMHRQGRCNLNKELSEHDMEEINDDIDRLLGIDENNEGRLNLELLGADEEHQLLLNAAKFFADKDNLPGGCMCSCCGKGLARSEVTFLDSRNCDLHKVCSTLLYVK